MKTQEFWQWFQSHKKNLQSFLHSDLSDYSHYETLSKKLTDFSEVLIPELTIDNDDNYILIISCDGNREGIPDAEALVNEAPQIENWIIKKYRQPSEFTSFPIDGLSFNKNEILIKYEEVPNENLYDIELYMKGYAPQDRRFDLAAAVYLDHNIGEFNAMMKIRHGSMKKLGLFTSKKDMVTLEEFAEVLDKLV